MASRDDVFLLRVQFFLFFFQVFRFRRLDFPLVCCEFLPAPFRWYGGWFPDRVSKSSKLSSCSLSCSLASSMIKSGQSQLGGNRESVALPGNPDQQPVGGAQGLHIEFAAGIFHTGRGEGVDLQLAVVGSRHGADALSRGGGRGWRWQAPLPRSGLYPLPTRRRAREISHWLFSSQDYIRHVGGGYEALFDASARLRCPRISKTERTE